MLLADVNAVVGAPRVDAPGHRGTRQWLRDALDGDEPFGVSEPVLSGAIRIATLARTWARPSTPSEALDFCEAVLGGPSAVPIRPGPDHFPIFLRLCREVGARANVVPDAYHAALAIEHGATWVTSDRGFARFPGLRWTTTPAR